jgi:hypothetical protein
LNWHRRLSRTVLYPFELRPHCLPKNKKPERCNGIVATSGDVFEAARLRAAVESYLILILDTSENFYMIPSVMANRRKPSTTRRNKLVMFSVSEQEKKLFFGMARWRHQSFAEFVRQILYREAKVSKVA